MAKRICKWCGWAGYPHEMLRVDWDPRASGDCFACPHCENMATEEDGEYHFQGFRIPRRMMDGIRRYVDQGIPPGDFLQAVICNDLVAAVSRADDENIRNLPAFVGYFYNEVPGPCWGSPQKMEAWIEKGGKHEEAKT